MTKPKSQINSAPVKAAAKAPETEAAKAPETEATKAPETEAAKAPETEATNAPEAEATNAPEAEAAKVPEVKKAKGKYSESISKRAKEVFESYDKDEIFFTSDESAFTIEQYAVMHGQNLKIQEVTTVKRSEV